MLSVYSFKIDIISHDSSMNEEEFRELTDPCLSYLEALEGAFGKKPYGATYYPPSHCENSTGWSLQYVIMISVGKERGENLIRFYPALARLIELEFPDFEIQAESAILSFS